MISNFKPVAFQEKIKFGSVVVVDKKLDGALITTVIPTVY